MTGKTELWDRLGRTDPAHTKSFQRAGGFRGTAIKPMWSYRRMTEEYGPCGVGWGVGEPIFQVVVVHASDEILVYCTVCVWHGARENTVFGVGGDKAVGKFSSGLKSDDEAFKKAFTDAVTNALKLIGVGADVHMGMFDDSKYVNEMKAEFKRENPHVTRPEDIFPAVEYDANGQPVDSVLWGDSEITPLPKKDARSIYRNLQAELHAHESAESLDKWATTIPDRVAALPRDWAEIFRGQFKEYKLRLKTKVPA